MVVMCPGCKGGGGGGGSSSGGGGGSSGKKGPRKQTPAEAAAAKKHQAAMEAASKAIKDAASKVASAVKGAQGAKDAAEKAAKAAAAHVKAAGKHAKTAGKHAKTAGKHAKTAGKHAKKAKKYADAAKKGPVKVPDMTNPLETVNFLGGDMAQARKGLHGPFDLMSPLAKIAEMEGKAAAAKACGKASKCSEPCGGSCAMLHKRADVHNTAWYLAADKLQTGSNVVIYSKGAKTNNMGGGVANGGGAGSVQAAKKEAKK